MSIKELTSLIEYDKVINIANTSPSKLIVLMFTADWCGACKNIYPTYESLSKNYKNIIFCMIDVDETKELATKFKITGMPTFIFIHKNIEKTRLAGANPQTLAAAIDKYSKEISVFSSSGGYALGSSSTAKPATANVPAAKSNVPAPSQAPLQKRVNPWADPNWKPPSAAVVEPPTKETTPVVVHNANTNSTILANNGVAPNISSTAPSQNFGNFKPEAVAMLVDMGFTEDRAKVACSKTDSNIEVAMEWLLNPANENVQMDIDPIPATSNAPPKDATAKIQAAAASLDNKPKWAPGQRGAPLGWKSHDEFEDESTIAMPKNLKASKPSVPVVSSSSAPVENLTEENAEKQFQSRFGGQNLTKEEKLQKLDEIRAEYRKNRDEAERKAVIEREKARIESEKKNTDLRRAMEDRDMQMQIDHKKREDQLAKERHKKILAKIAADKEKRAMEKAAADALKAANANKQP